MPFNKIPLLILGLSYCVLPAHAEIYKWTDANGKVQYSDAPPGSGKANANVVKTAPAPATSPKEASWEEKDREFRARKAEQGATAPTEEDSRRASMRLCMEARARLAAFNGSAVYRVGKNGERVYIEDSERAAMEKSARDTVAQNCPR
jgi:hypothetical protein